MTIWIDWEHTHYILINALIFNQSSVVPSITVDCNTIVIIGVSGYGSVAPRTVWGRLITIVYALAGIPLMLVYLSTVGDVLSRSFRRLYGRLCRPRNCTRKQQPPPPPPPVGGMMSKTYRYDNHVDSKSGNYYSASRESSCDDLGTRGTSSAILLDCGSEGLLHATTSSTAALQV